MDCLLVGGKDGTCGQYSCPSITEGCIMQRRSLTKIPGLWSQSLFIVCYENLDQSQSCLAQLRNVCNFKNVIYTVYLIYCKAMLHKLICITVFCIYQTKKKKSLLLLQPINININVNRRLLC